MSEWVYKAAPTRATRDDTHDIAVFHHFLCRAAYDDDGVRLVSKVGDVAVGDIIHFYFRGDRAQVTSFGSFSVGSASTYPGVFEPCEDHGALTSVIESPDNAKLLALLGRGYEQDIKLGKFTGWVITRLPSSTATPKFDQRTLFPGPTTTLWQYPDPALPNTKRK